MILCQLLGAELVDDMDNAQLALFSKQDDFDEWVRTYGRFVEIIRQDQKWPNINGTFFRHL